MQQDIEISTEEAGYLIIGITNNGQKFRPSDWVERVASVCGCIDGRHRLHYNPIVKPMQLNEVHGLFLASRLSILNPDAYQYVMDFSYSNDLQMMTIGLPDKMAHVA
jgi:hypothetical protein